MDQPTDGHASCSHCGTPFRPRTQDQTFCCSGCQFVHGLIRDQGLDRFYELKGSGALEPVGTRAFDQRDWAWLSQLGAEAEAEAEAAGRPAARIRLKVAGISCLGCVWLMDALRQRCAPTAQLLTNAARGTIQLSWPASPKGSFDPATLAAELGRFGYRLEPVGADDPAGQSSPLVVLLGACGALALNCMAFTLPRYLGMEASFPLANLFLLVAFVSASLSFALGGWYFSRRAWVALRAGRLHIDLPIALGLIAAYLGSLAGLHWQLESLLYFDFVAVFTFLMLLGRWTQEEAVARNRSRALPGETGLESVTLITPGGNPSRISSSELEEGQVVELSGGAVVPANAELLIEGGDFSLQWINGEPDARSWPAGATVPGGAIYLGAAPIQLRLIEPWRGSLLEQLSTSPSPDPTPTPKDLARSQNLPLQIYLASVLVIAVLGAIAWWDGGRQAPKAIQVAVSVLVVSCPCALGLALPLAQELSVGGLRRLGLFIRCQDLWPRLRRVRQVVFDKTGTLTLETPQLEEAQALDALAPKAQLALASLVWSSRHPASQALREALAARQINSSQAPPIQVRETPGQGLEGLDADGHLWRLGRPSWADEASPTTMGSPALQAQATFASDGQALAHFSFREELRPDVISTVDTLRRLGLRIALLSGDRASKVAHVARSLDIPDDLWRAELDPAGKLAWLEDHGPDRTLYLGDGANDRLAFEAALCRGTPATDHGMLAQGADFAYLGQGLSPLLALFAISQRRRRATLAAATFAVSYNVGAIGLSLAGWMNPLAAAILMPASSLVTIAIVIAHLRQPR